MMLLEHDAKVLLAQFGISIPVGVLVNRSAHPAVSYPCFVKVQIPVGGRGKAGGIVKANDASELEQALHRAAIVRVTSQSITGFGGIGDQATAAQHLGRHADQTRLRVSWMYLDMTRHG